MAPPHVIIGIYFLDGFTDLLYNSNIHIMLLITVLFYKFYLVKSGHEIILPMLVIGVICVHCDQLH